MKSLFFSSERVYLSFFYFLLFELVLCGSGQVIHVLGPLTLRMFNFILALFFTLLIMRKHTINGRAFSLYVFYLFYISILTSISLLINDKIFVFEDIKPISFFLCFPFLYFMIKDRVIINNIVKIVKWGAFIQAIIYLIYLIFVKSGLIGFLVTYVLLSKESDIMFRGDGGELFYKGFVFLPIGLIFFLEEKKYVHVIMLLVAIFFTLTRGFYVITLLGVLGHYWVTHKIRINQIILLLFFSALSLWAISYFELFEMGEARSEGDMVRITTIKQVLERITPFTFFIGHGLGLGVPIREVHMEMSFLEIFHKQGIVGLCFWFYLLAKIACAWKKTKGDYKRISNLFFIGSVLIYVQSLFNPYINNPMGIGFVLISYFICRKMYILYENTLCYRSV